MTVSTSFAQENLHIHEVWGSIKERLKKEYGEATFKSWLRHLELREYSKNEIVLSVPTRFIREWINNNYLKNIKLIWKEYDSAITSFTLLVRPASAQQKQANASVGNSVETLNTPLTNESSNQSFDVDKLGSPLDPRYTFDSFVVGQGNKLALAAAKSVAKKASVIPGNNPFYLYGGVGLGKTHLLHAIAWEVKKQNPELNVLYLSAERFMYQFVRSLREKTVMNFKEIFRHVDVLLVDDVQFICGKESTQEEFYHTCSALLDMNKILIISGDRSPADLDGMKERMRSKLGWGLVVDISPSDFSLRLDILKAKANAVNDVDVPVEVLEFLAHRITSNIRELEGALNKVIAHASLMGEGITLESTQYILKDLLRANERVLTILDIQRRVAEYFNIKMSDMSSSSRARVVARPRQMAMYLAKHHTSRSLAEIGRKFGGKDHTTVMHAVKRIESLRLSDSEFKEELHSLTQTVITN